MAEARISPGKAARRVAVFRADGNAQMGFGHLARCSALARHLAVLNWDCRLATCSEGPWPDGTLEFEEVVQLDAGEGSDGRALRRAASECDVFVADSYELDAGFERNCRPWARKIVAIDDLADRPHDADMLIDAASMERRESYRGLVSEDCELLTGPDHALLRPEFFARRIAEGSRRGPKRTLVALGSGPVAALAEAAAKAIHEFWPDAAIDVVVSPAGPAPNLEGVRADRVSVHRGHANMVELIGAACFGVGACGVTAWERCSLGLASVAVLTAANQIHVAEALRQAGAAVVVKADPEAVKSAIRQTIGDEKARRDVASAAAQLCDGLGAARLAAVLDADPRARDGQSVRLRPLRRSDAALLLRWQSDPRTRAFSHNTAVPTADEHRSWLERKLGDHNTILAMIMQGGSAAGVLRLDRLSQAAEAWLVSIYTAPDRYRLGLAGCALALAHRIRPQASFVAEVVPDNAPSHALFRSAGYVWRTGRYERTPFAIQAESAA